MSVNAINGVNPQQGQDKRSVLPAAIAGGTVLGTAGAAAGYLFGGKKPSLEEVFAQDPDTFESNMKKMGEKDAEATKILQDERNVIYEDADVKAKKDALKQKVKEIEKLVYARTDYANKAELDKTLADAENELKNLAKDATDAEKNAVNAKIENAKNAILDAKLEKFSVDMATKTIRDEFNVLESELTTAINESIGKSAQKDTIKEAFGKVKKTLVEGKGKAVAIWGGIALLTGLIISTVFGGSKRPEIANQ